MLEMGILFKKKNKDYLLLELDKTEENIIKQVEDEADEELKKLVDTLRLIKNIKNRGLYILNKLNELNIILKRGVNPVGKEFDRNEYIQASLDVVEEQLRKLQVEELDALKEEKVEDKLEKFMIDLTNKAEEISKRVESQLNKNK